MSSSISAESREKKLKRVILILSIGIPLAVAALFGIKIEGYDTSFLPPIYATINGITAVILMAALWAIKQKKVDLHQLFVKVALGCSVAFLLLYIVYHITSDSTAYGGEGIAAGFYYFLLISHIVLSVAVIPFVLITYLRANLQQFDRHKKIARYAFPLWLYVAVSGVVVYVMISPYY